MTDVPTPSKGHALTFAAAVLGLGGAVLFAPLTERLSPRQPVSSAVVAPAGHGPPAGGSLDGFFPIGVWVPPVTDFAKWKDRGVNTVVEVPQGHDVERWTAEARRQGLRMIRAPRPRPEDDLREELLLAWLLPDEPELKRAPPASLLDSYQALKAVDSGRPVMVNFSGGYVLGLQRSCNASCYRAYVAAADWISNDVYPVTGWDRADALQWVGRAITTLRPLSADRPQFAFIETSDQGLDDGRNARGVTPSELRAEIWSAIIAGARGIWYFPPAFNPFQFDATPPDVVAELTRQNAMITSLAAVLQGEINPRSIGARVQAPLQVTWRTSAEGDYVIVLNLSDTPQNGQVITLDGIAATSAGAVGENRSVPIVAEALRDDFGPYGLHIYKIARSAPTGER